jgi:hypothetical protein
MDTLTVDKPQVIASSDPHARTNLELRSARGVLWGIVGGGTLWCLIGAALWFSFH